MIVSESGYEYPDRLHAHSLSFFLSLAMQQWLFKIVWYMNMLKWWRGGRWMRGGDSCLRAHSIFGYKSEQYFTIILYLHSYNNKLFI